MVQTWKTQQEPDITCEQCGATYKVTSRGFPLKESDSYRCEECGRTLKSWNGTTAYEFEIKK